MTHSDTASLVAELRELSEWLKPLHHLHPKPTHLELNLARQSVNKAIEALTDWSTYKAEQKRGESRVQTAAPGF